MKEKGRISYYNNEKGYGYIQEPRGRDREEDSGNPDEIFFHISEVKRNFRHENLEIANYIPMKGDLVSYDKDFNKDKNKDQAKDVSVARIEPGHLIFKWASFGSLDNYNKIISDLEGRALKENWTLLQTSPQPLNILHNYFRYTFYRLAMEGKVKELDRYAAFNTGLVDRRYEYIYALFEKNREKGGQFWYFKCFCCEGEDEGKELVKYFNPIPEVAQYFNNPADLFYEFKKPPSCDWDHVILDGIKHGRYPIFFLKEYSNRDFIFPDFDKMDNNEKNVFFEKYTKIVKEDTKLYNRIKVALEDALKLTWNRLKWNYKTAIPQYYAPRNEISLLLPVSLRPNEEEVVAHIALVVSKEQSGNYQIQTILPLAHAYSNARLVCRPLSDWLEIDKIQEPPIDSGLD